MKHYHDALFKLSAVFDASGPELIVIMIAMFMCTWI